jgi:D-apionolactonase
LKYENGAIRWIKNNGAEIVRMIYSAVRDHNWGTIEPEIIEEKIEENETGFLIETRVTYRKADIYFEAGYKITGNEYRLVFEMDGESKSIFMTNRTGFCVLHPIKECCGKTCIVIHPDETSEKTVFPELISPDQPMLNISGLVWEPAENIHAKLQFSGDIFEMEDQRNWTDASYKTYCRPLSLPFPYEIKKGEKIQQKIVLEIHCEPQKDAAEDSILFEIDSQNRFKIPEIGVGATSRNEKLEHSEAEILKQLPIQHLRVELKLFEKNWIHNLKLAEEESRLLELPLFLVLYFSEAFKNELETLQNTFQNKNIKVKYVLVVGKNHLPNDLIFDEFFSELKNIFPSAKIGAGVNAYFAEFNRNRPKSEKAEFISFAVCPQIHAFDNSTLVENMEAQKYAVESAQQIFAERPVFVSPVTLKQRFNVVATSEETEYKSNELPSQVDVRQNSVFTAQWLLGSLKFLAQSGTELVTYFETVGWRGFIQGNYNPPLPEIFSARKGDIYPVFYLLKELEGFDEVIFSESSAPLEVDGIVLQGKDLNDKTINKILLANFSSHTKKVKISGIETASFCNTLFSSTHIEKENGYFEFPGNQIVIIPVL